MVAYGSVPRRTRRLLKNPWKPAAVEESPRSGKFQKEKMTRNAFMIGSLLLLAVAAGCASSPALRTDSSTTAIRAAEAVGANNVPNAALHLQMAREELELAKGMADKGQKDQASSQLLRAEADAQLAVVLSQEQNEKADAQQAMERVHQLQNDNR